MNEVVLLIGGNLGNRLEIINQSFVHIANKIGIIKKRSSIYESAPWGFEAEQDFLNLVVVVETKWDSNSVLERINEIETEMGRIRTGNGYTSRIIDIDILFFNDAVIDMPRLQIPHLHLHERRFTLLPLYEINPEKYHPVLQKNIAMLLEECNDKGKVIIYKS